MSSRGDEWSAKIAVEKIAVETAAAAQKVAQDKTSADLMMARTAAAAQKAAGKAQAAYGDIKNDLLRRLLAYFGPMRERRADFEKRIDDVEGVLLDGARRAREIGAPILDEVRQAAGFRPRT